MMKVELLWREGCCLCAKMHQVLTRLRAELPFDLIEIDIDGPTTPAPEYRALHGMEIPVVRVAGAVVARLHADEAALRAMLASHAKTSRSD